MAIKIEYLWQDRKRHLGLPISFTKYSLSEDRLFVTEGFLNIRDDEVCCTGCGISIPTVPCGRGFSAWAR